jgi:Rps23 Pro-64 3,4-dihydroxylase Tpa1-like proline 4-hydroxylase
MRNQDLNVHTDQNLVNLDLFTKSLAKLRNDSESFQKRYAVGKPYPHIVIDDLFEPEILDRVVSEFPKAENRDWIDWNTDYENKATSKGIARLSMFTQIFSLWLNSSEFIEQIKLITGIEDLVPDPLFFGAGLHDMYRGGWLEMHADYTKHPVLPLTRRVNLLIYLNKDWNPNWGGGLELWDSPNPTQKVNYPCFFNRTIIFPTTSKTLHGVPKLLSCPPDRGRQLLSIYYWSPAPSAVEEGTLITWASEQNSMMKTKKRLRKIVKKLIGCRVS